MVVHISNWLWSWIMGSYSHGTYGWAVPKHLWPWGTPPEYPQWVMSGAKKHTKCCPFCKGHFRLKIPPKTLPNCTEKVKTRVFDAQDHEDSIFDGPKPLFLTILAQKWDFVWVWRILHTKNAPFHPLNTPLHPITPLRLFHSTSKPTCRPSRPLITPPSFQTVFVRFWPQNSDLPYPPEASHRSS